MNSNSSEEKQGLHGIASATRIGALLLLIATLAAAPGCTQTADGANPTTDAAVPVSVAPVERERVERTVEVEGTLLADEEVTLATRVGGRVARVLADVGDVVSGRAPLARLDEAELRRAESIARLTLEGVLARLGTDRLPGTDFQPDGTALVARASAQLENARARLGRLRELEQEDQGFVAAQDLRDAETAVASAAAELEVERLATRALVSEAGLRAEELELARLRREDATIAAPESRSWVVAGRFVSEGELAAPGVPVFRLVATERLKLHATVEEGEARSVRKGLAARVSVAGWDDRPFPGLVVRVSPTVDPQTRTFVVEVLVPNESGRLRPGSFATARLVTGEEDVLSVPEDSVASSAGTERVFVVVGDRARERVVSTGERRGRRVEVRGVEAGASVVTRGQTALVDGALVRVARAVDPARERRP